MKDYHVNIFFSEEDGCYVADIPDLEACSAFGDTPEPVIEALRETTMHLTAQALADLSWPDRLQAGSAGTGRALFEEVPGSAPDGEVHGEGVVDLDRLPAGCRGLSACQPTGPCTAR